MSSTLILIIIAIYFAILFGVSIVTGRKADEDTFFRGNKSSPWYLVAFGMIGASISGVTFISVPGWVGSQQFAYMVMVFGYLAGYIVIAFVLLPLYYRLNLTSIYKYLETRFGHYSYKTGASFFMLSRVLGSAFRLYLVASVLDIWVFADMGIPFAATVAISIALIWLYTFKGGIKTVIWTDALQTFLLLLAASLSVYFIAKEMGLESPGQVIDIISESKYSKMIFSDIGHPKQWLKQFLGGMFIAISMTGLDQDMMQKNLTCKSLGDAQKNMVSFSVILIFVNLLFLGLGALLYLYGTSKGLVIEQFGVEGHLPLGFLDEGATTYSDGMTDQLFPFLAFKHLPPFVGAVFILGLIAAAYSSADSALTALTTSVCIDFLNFENKTDIQKKNRTRQIVHVAMSLVMFVSILIFHLVNNTAVIGAIFTAATYTYGPLLGLYTFGLFTKLSVRDKWVPLVCILSPVICYLINLGTGDWLGFSTLPVNGALTFLGLLLISQGSSQETLRKA